MSRHCEGALVLARSVAHLPWRAVPGKNKYAPRNDGLQLIWLTQHQQIQLATLTDFVFLIEHFYRGDQRAGADAW